MVKTELTPKSRPVPPKLKEKPIELGPRANSVLTFRQKKGIGLTERVIRRRYVGGGVVDLDQESRRRG